MENLENIDTSSATFWLMLSRFVPTQSSNTLELIYYVRRRFSSNRSARIKRFLRRQQEAREAFQALLSEYDSHTTTRSIWVRQRCGVWWEHVNTSWTEQDWQLNFRMKKTSFQHLCDILRPHLQRENTTFRKAVSVEQRVAICIWRLATNMEFRTISHLFGIGKSTVVGITNHVASVIVDKLLPSFIKIPSESELSEIIQGFKDRWGFPQCGGAIDAIHIRILAPSDSPADYYNSKGFYSVILQGVVDHRLRFWDINVGWPGKVHDARVFGNSSLYEQGQSGTLFPNITESLNGVDVPVVLLGDAAYPLLPWLMKVYPENEPTTPEQLSYNHSLSVARMTVERAFGRLKGRWRCLMKRYDCHISHINTIISACCVLHNFCEDNSEDYEDADVFEESASNNSSDLCASNSANNIRDALCSYFTGT